MPLFIGIRLLKFQPQSMGMRLTKIVNQEIVTQIILIKGQDSGIFHLRNVNQATTTKGMLMDNYAFILRNCIHKECYS